MNQQYTIEFDTRRCVECGSYWAIESFRKFSATVCPCCAETQIDKANERANAAERSMHSLRGALTRLKKN